MFAHDKVLVGFAAIISRRTIESASRKRANYPYQGFYRSKTTPHRCFFQIVEYEYGAVERFRKAEFDEISFARHSIPSAQAAAIVAFPTATPELISASFMSLAENLSRVIFSFSTSPCPESRFRCRLLRICSRLFAVLPGFSATCFARRGSFCPRNLQSTVCCRSQTVSFRCLR